MKLIFLGTCAGTEPMPDRKHASFVLEVGATLYWFDAGEGCSYTAQKVQRLFGEKAVICFDGMTETL